MSGFDDRLARERRARLQAERLLAQRSEELYSANKKLAEHAHALSHQVIEQREAHAALLGRSSKTEAALEHATEKADIAERRLWDALLAVEDGFAIYDRDWRLVAANDAFIAAFDGITDVAPGASYEFLLRLATEEGIVDLEGEPPDDWVDRMLARWEGDSIPQIDIKLWNGAFVRLVDKRTPDGDVVSIALNITDTVRRERELRKARDEAEAAARAKSAFLANMSHEIRTPMNGVVSMAEMLRETDLSEEQQLYADTIRNSGEALLVIINDILDYSKIDAGKLVLHRASFNLEAIVHEIFRLLRPSIGEKNLTLRLDYDIFLPDKMIGDPGRLRQILTNLIGNAVKFTEAGEVLVQIVGQPPPESDHQVPIRVVVHDTGIGIPEDMRDHVFGEFNQVESDANRSFDGTGLGLAITRRLVHLMGGEMWLESEVGVGSSFGFALVLDADPEATQTPVPPLPEDCAGILALDGGRPMPDSILAHLLRLKAVLREERDIAAVPTGMHAVVLGPGIADPGAVADRLRGAGHRGPVVAIAAEPAPPEQPPQSAVEVYLTLPETVPLPQFREALALRPHPFEPEAPAEPAPEDGDLRVTAPAPPRRLRLLAAEDNKTNQLVFKTMLKSLDLDLTLVENGRLAVEQVRAARPDVLFTDISMPEMDGIEAAKSIRAQEASEGLSPLPIVAMTAHTLPEDRERILAAGIDECLTKPLNKGDLHAMIRQFAPEGIAL
jgi:signal transduction histidine kinase/CheY-like chemotaxis protein